MYHPYETYDKNAWEEYKAWRAREIHTCAILPPSPLQVWPIEAPEPSTTPNGTHLHCV